MVLSLPPFSLDAHLVQDELTSICNGPWQICLLLIQVCDRPQSTINISKISLPRMRSLSRLDRSELDRRGIVWEIYESINTLNLCKVGSNLSGCPTDRFPPWSGKRRELSARSSTPSAMNQAASFQDSTLSLQCSIWRELQ